MVLLTLQDVKTFSQISQKPINGFGRKEGLNWWWALLSTFVVGWPGNVFLVVQVLVELCALQGPSSLFFFFMCGLEIPQPRNRP